jgi:hypothetical protein
LPGRVEHVGVTMANNAKGRGHQSRTNDWQSNRKADEGSKHPDRNAQFEHINAKAIAAQAAGQPVISVDTKKKELIGNYKNGGTDYRPKGDPRRVKVHDFKDKKLGKVGPMACTMWAPMQGG